MAYLIDDLDGISAADRAKLARAGIRTTGELIQACSTEEGRAEVSRTTGLDAEQLLTWVNVADLMRIDGVGQQYAELLGESGIPSIAALRRQRPEELATIVRRINSSKRLVKTTPSPNTIGRWVDAARQLPHKVFH